MKNPPEIKEFKRERTRDHIKVLKAIYEIPFPIGKNLLADFLVGDYKNDSIINNSLDNLKSFGSLEIEKEEIKSIIDNLIINNLITQRNSDANHLRRKKCLIISSFKNQI